MFLITYSLAMFAAMFLVSTTKEHPISICLLGIVVASPIIMLLQVPNFALCSPKQFCIIAKDSLLVDLAAILLNTLPKMLKTFHSHSNSL